MCVSPKALVSIFMSLAATCCLFFTDYVSYCSGVHASCTHVERNVQFGGCVHTHIHRSVVEGCHN